MSNQLTAQPRASALSLMAERCNVDPAKLHSTLKNTVFKGATDDELLALVVTANVYQLNPLLKEMYAFPKKGGGITPMVGIDGWLKIANRQENFDGMEVEVYGDGKTPTHATCTIHLKDRGHAIKITEYFDECRRNTEPWNQMPRRMLRNKAIIQAIRVAFGIAGIQDEDEAEDTARNAALRNAPGRVVDVETNPFGDPEPEEEAPPKEPTKTRSRAKKVEPEETEAPTPAETEDEQPGIRAFYEEHKVQRSPEGAAKPWTRWILSYGLPNGPIREASTFSATIGDLIDTMQGGEEIRIEVIDSAKGDTIKSLVLVEGGEA